MRYLLGFAFLLLMLGGLRMGLALFEGEKPKPRRLFACQCGANTLELAELMRGRELRNHVATDSFYFYWYAERWPALLWNGQLIASAPLAGAYEGEDPGLPFLPVEKARVTTTSFRVQAAKGDWNVYLSPRQHGREQYEVIAACARQHLEALQKAMDTPAKYWWSKTNFPMESRAKRLASISWGEVPETMVFTTDRPFSLPPGPGEKPFPEVLYIRPDGRWDIALGTYRGMVKGRLVAVGEGFRFETTQGPNPEKPVMSDPLYLSGWRNAEGKPLSDFVPLAQE